LIKQAEDSSISLCGNIDMTEVANGADNEMDIAFGLNASYQKGCGLGVPSTADKQSARCFWRYRELHLQSRLNTTLLSFLQQQGERQKDNEVEESEASGIGEEG
jgi:hypothetical protein